VVHVLHPLLEPGVLCVHVQELGLVLSPLENKDENKKSCKEKIAHYYNRYQSILE